VVHGANLLFIPKLRLLHLANREKYIKVVFFLRKGNQSKDKHCAHVVGDIFTTFFEFTVMIILLMLDCHFVVDKNRLTVDRSSHNRFEALLGCTCQNTHGKRHLSG